MHTGAILFTTRDGRTRETHDTKEVRIGLMNDREAAELFFKLVGLQYDSRHGIQVRKLLELFGNLPLAIAQATAYIRMIHTPGDDATKFYKVSGSLVLETLVPRCPIPSIVH